MTAETIFEIFDIVTELTKEAVIGDSLGDEEIETMLRELVHRGIDAYEEHTGEPLFPGLIKSEDSV